MSKKYDFYYILVRILLTCSILLSTLPLTPSPVNAMVDFSKTKPSTHFVDLTAINPYLDHLIKILTSPVNSRQSTTYGEHGLNAAFDDPHELLKEDAHLTHHKIRQMIMDDFLRRRAYTSEQKGGWEYGTLPDNTTFLRP
jgi:hypothetical protein